MKGGRGLSCNACEAGLGCGMRGGGGFRAVLARVLS